MAGDLEALRKEIDKVDEGILDLLNKRAEFVVQVGKVKKVAKETFYAPNREREILNRLQKMNRGPFPNEALQIIFREILSASLALEEPLKVAYLGPKATFTHQACIQKFGLSATYIPATSIREVFNEVDRGRAEFGVVPIENSTEGVVNHTLDMFVDSDLLISAEILQEVSHHLLSKGGKLSDVKRIYSHPHAIAQCSGWLEANLPHVPTTEVYSTAKAAEWCVEDPTAGAIASELAGRLYGLQILKKKIEDNPNNMTRFLVISKRPAVRTGRDKTSVVFSIKDRVGALYDMLKPFSANTINLTKIESRPSKKKAWEYLFYVDLAGHLDDENVKTALKELKGQCLFLKILGSYPMAA